MRIIGQITGLVVVPDPQKWLSQSPSPWPPPRIRSMLFWLKEITYVDHIMSHELISSGDEYDHDNMRLMQSSPNLAIFETEATISNRPLSFPANASRETVLGFPIPGQLWPAASTTILSPPCRIPPNRVKMKTVMVSVMSKELRNRSTSF
jgi:hypothetical protein